MLIEYRINQAIAGMGGLGAIEGALSRAGGEAGSVEDSLIDGIGIAPFPILGIYDINPLLGGSAPPSGYRLEG